MGRSLTVKKRPFEPFGAYRAHGTAVTHGMNMIDFSRALWPVSRSDFSSKFASNRRYTLSPFQRPVWLDIRPAHFYPSLP